MKLKREEKRSSEEVKIPLCVLREKCATEIDFVTLFSSFQVQTCIYLKYTNKRKIALHCFSISLVLFNKIWSFFLGIFNNDANNVLILNTLYSLFNHCHCLKDWSFWYNYLILSLYQNVWFYFLSHDHILNSLIVSIGLESLLKAYSRSSFSNPLRLPLTFQLPL